jgi:sialidase-1
MRRFADSFKEKRTLKETQLFVSGQDGYDTYRIPALVVSNRGTLLAFCEGRKHSRSDSGEIAILLKRSFDNGQTWETMQVVVDDGPHTDGNPAPVVDSSTGTIWLLFCRNLADGPESMIIAGKAPRTVWITYSTDDGATWVEAKEITEDVKAASWTWYATGPCHGLQLQSGRLAIPCDHVDGNTRDYSAFGHSHIIYSDDHGENWRVGGIAQAGTNESVVAQTVDGRLYLNCRNYRDEKRRAYAWSDNNGDTFSQFGYHDNLVEPICQASMIRYTDVATHDKNRILFANPASAKRERMTVRISYDECHQHLIVAEVEETAAFYEATFGAQKTEATE